MHFRKRTEEGKEVYSRGEKLGSAEADAAEVRELRARGQIDLLRAEAEKALGPLEAAIDTLFEVAEALDVIAGKPKGVRWPFKRPPGPA